MLLLTLTYRAVSSPPPPPPAENHPDVPDYDWVHGEGEKLGGDIHGAVRPGLAHRPPNALPVHSIPPLRSFVPRDLWLVYDS